MTDEERQRTMDFILQQQARFAANMQKLEEADTRAGQRIERLERVVKLAIRAGVRERKDTRAKLDALIDSHIKLADSHVKLTDAQAKLADAQVRLADSQTHTDRRLDALIDIVRDEREGSS